MKVTASTLLAPVSTAWRRLAPRDRKALGAMGLGLVVALAYFAIWQPAQLRLKAAERTHHQQLTVAEQVSRAQGPSVRANNAQPLSVQLNQRALADGLELKQLEVQDHILRLTISGDALVLLAWIHQTEQAGAMLQSLSLDKRGEHLEAQLVVEEPASL